MAARSGKALIPAAVPVPPPIPHQVIRNQVPADQLMAWSAEYFKKKINTESKEDA